MARTFFNLFAVFVLVLQVSGCASKNTKRAEDDAALHLQIGTTLFTNGKYPAALQELLIAEKLDPKNATVQNNLALTYFVRDRFDLAQIHVERAIQLKPEYTEARNNRARILIERGNYAEAIEEAKRVNNDLTYQFPIRGWTNISLAYFRKGDFAKARDSATAALKIERDNCFAQTILGRSLLELKNTKDAADTLDRAVIACLKEGQDEAAYFAGLAQYQLGKSSAAIARLQTVLKDYPNGSYAKKAVSLLEIIK
jgi:type IV pilus assembly protein PilF